MSVSRAISIFERRTQRTHTCESPRTPEEPMHIFSPRNRVLLFVAAVVFYLVVVTVSVMARIPSGPVVSVVPLAAAVWAFGFRVGVVVLVLELTVRGVLYSSGILPPGVPTILVLVPMVFTDTAMLLVVTALRQAQARQAAIEEQLRAKNGELETALGEVKELRGMLPICAWCKGVRDVDGMWNKLEAYLAKHSRATFTHGICPQCLARVTDEASNLAPPA